MTQKYTVPIIIAAVVIVIILLFFILKKKKHTPYTPPTPTPTPTPVSNSYQGCWAFPDVPNGFVFPNGADYGALFGGTLTLEEIKNIIRAKYPGTKYIAITGQVQNATNLGIYVVLGNALPQSSNKLANESKIPRCNIEQNGFKIGCKTDVQNSLCAGSTNPVGQTWTVYKV